MRMQCMSIYHQINITQPKKFHKKSQKPQKFSKTQNLGLKMHECMKNRDWEVSPSDLSLKKAENHVGEEILEWERVLDQEREFSREREKRKRNLNCACPLNGKHSLMDRRFYRGSVKH